MTNRLASWRACLITVGAVAAAAADGRVSLTGSMELGWWLVLFPVAGYVCGLVLQRVMAAYSPFRRAGES